jgi:starch synthase
MVHSPDLIEEWLDHLELSLDDLKQKLMGSWFFSYADALASAGVRSVLIFITGRVSNPERSIHIPTGAVIWLLPPPPAYSALRRVPAVRQHVAPYVATPLRALGRVLRSEQCDAIIVQEYECPRFDVAALLGRLLRIPVFPCFHAGDGRSCFEGLLHPISMASCAGVIISADFEARRAREAYGIPDAKIGRIPNPVDESVWRPMDRDQARLSLGISRRALVAVWHGAVYLRIKGLDVLAEAWDEVRRGQKPDVRLTLVGGGVDGAALEKLFERHGDDGVIFPAGWVHNRELLRRYLSAADVYVLPSRNEGYPNAVIEAMACGLPVVATDIAGVPDIVGRGEAAAGILVPSGNSSALAQAIQKLFDDEELRSELGRRARDRAAAHSLPTVGHQMRAFFEERGMSST